MMMYIVVPGLIVVVILVVVLVALGMRANRAGADEDDWNDEQPHPQPRGRRAAPPPVEEPAEDGYEDHGTGAGYDRRVAGGPLAAPTG
ncbi:MAG TPA: hypothetical protein VHJ17_10455, partial [Thermomonospora sp.]|nr:hypothetical protein [Thermomonospora sp.]